jgi:hypothetical protein
MKITALRGRQMLKKILVIHPYLHDVIGGGEEVLLKILEVLIERNCDISLLGELPSGSIFDNLSFTNIRQIHYTSEVDLKPKRFQVHRRLLFCPLQLKGKLRREVGKMDLEINTLDPMYFIGVGKKSVAYIAT